MKLKRMEHVELLGEYPWLPGGKLTRWLVGRPMDNIIRTDANFFHDATKGYPSRWLRLAGWKRSAIRISTTYGSLLISVSALLLLAGRGEIVLRILLWHLLLLSPVLLLADRRMRQEYGLRLPTWRAMETENPETGEMEMCRAWRIETLRPGRRAWEQDVVIPLARALAPLLSLERRPEEARTWVTVPLDYQESGAAPVEVLLPPSFSGADEGVRRRIERAAAARLQMLEISATWHLHGAHPRLLISALPKPPKLISFADVEKYLLKTVEYRPLLGVVGSGEALHAEMVADSPHIGISGGPGSGKSTLMKLIKMQVLRWGWGVIIIDWKQTEAFRWARDLPGVTYVTEIEAIHDMGIRLGEEVDIRKTQGLTGRAKILVVRDEWNATADLLMAWWQDFRASMEPAERQRTPVKSPALRGYAIIDFAGREFGVHDLVAAQRFSARVFNGNADIRECFQIKLLARYSDSTRKMLAPDIKPFPKKSNIPGRWTVVAGDEVVVCQVPLIENEAARIYAQGGIANPLSPFSSSYEPGPAQLPEEDGTQGKELPHGVAGGSSDADVIEGEEVEIRAMKLRDLAKILKPFGVTYKILQHARDDEESHFPKPYGGNRFRGYTYDLQAVKIWTRRRHASQITDRKAD